MEYLIDLRFEDKDFNAIVHFVATFIVKDVYNAISFICELEADLKRKGVVIHSLTYYRIDNDPMLKERSYIYCQFCKSRATASIEIEQFILDSPDQNKSLAENLTDKLFNGESSTAKICNKYKIPVRVYDKQTRKPITCEFYYFTIVHLTPKE